MCRHTDFGRFKRSSGERLTGFGRPVSRKISKKAIFLGFFIKFIGHPRTEFDFWEISTFFFQFILVKKVKANKVFLIGKTIRKAAIFKVFNTACFEGFFQAQRAFRLLICGYFESNRLISGSRYRLLFEISLINQENLIKKNLYSVSCVERSSKPWNFKSFIFLRVSSSCTEKSSISFSFCLILVLL